MRDIDPIFVGRRASLDELRGHVQRGERLITVLGGPGLGKSRLAARFALESRDLFSDVWWVDTSAAVSGDDVLAAVSQALGVQVPAPGGEGIDALAAALASSGERGLILLDGLEQAVGGAAELVRRGLGCVPSLVVLATSQVPLALASELRFELDPLTPADARELFVARAAQRVRGYEITARERAELDELLKLLDNIPLAVELAASRVDTMPLGELRRRLDTGFAILKAQRRDAPKRHATMQSAIAWSWRLLSSQERAVLSQLSVFAGPFTVQAAEAVVRIEGPVSTLDLLQALRERSLLRAAGEEGSRCVRLFDSVRAFARAHLGEQEQAVLDRHALFFADRFEASTHVMFGLPGEVTLANLEREQDDLLAAMSNALDCAPEVATKCAIVLARIFAVRGPGWLGWDVLERVVSRTRTLESRPDLLARVLIARAAFARAWLGRTDLQDELYEALAILRRSPLQPLESEARGYLGVLLTESGHHDAGQVEIARALEMAEADDNNPVGETLCRGAWAMHCFERGHFADCVRAYDRTLASPGASASTRMTARYRTSRARAQFERGHLDEARDDYEEALALQTDIDDRLYLPVTLLGLAGLHLTLRDRAVALEFAKDAELRVRRSGFHRFRCAPSVVLGWIYLDTGELDAARKAFVGVLGAQPSGRARGSAQAGLGLVALVEGDPKYAVEEIAKAVPPEPLPGYHMAPVYRAILAVGQCLAGCDDAVVQRTITGAVRDANASESRRVRDVVFHVSSALGGPAVEPPAALWTEFRILRQMWRRMSISEGWMYEAQSAVLTAPSGKQIELSSRPLLARLVFELAVARSEMPGIAVSRDDLIRTLWPGDLGSVAAKANRLWVAVSTLRKLGLTDLLVRSEAGYLFDPSIPFRQRPPPEPSPTQISAKQT